MKMKKYIVPLICYSMIILILTNVDKISTFLTKAISSNNHLTIDKGNEYTKNYDFLYVSNSIDY